MGAREDRTDTHYASFGGTLRSGAGHPGTIFTSTSDLRTGDVWLDTSNNRLYICITPSTQSWKYIGLATTSTSSSSSSSSSTSSSSTTTMA